MSGTRAGGLRAVQTNKQLYGDNFYRTIGTMGGRKSRGGGFAASPERARIAGKKGGKVSRRGVAMHSQLINHVEPPATPKKKSAFDIQAILRLRGRHDK